MTWLDTVNFQNSIVSSFMLDFCVFTQLCVFSKLADDCSAAKTVSYLQKMDILVKV